VITLIFSQVKEADSPRLLRHHPRFSQLAPIHFWRYTILAHYIPENTIGLQPCPQKPHVFPSGLGELNSSLEDAVTAGLTCIGDRVPCCPGSETLTVLVHSASRAVCLLDEGCIPYKLPARDYASNSYNLGVSIVGRVKTHEFHAQGSFLVFGICCSIMSIVWVISKRKTKADSRLQCSQEHMPGLWIL